MKFDIFDAHYPNSLFLSNSLREGIFPLWNPQFSYGLPHYANVGMPVYYPTTVFFSILGYQLWMMAAEYSIHLLIACYGMNRYVRFSLRDEKNQQLCQWIALFSGLLYGFSGTFTGNAQHIMIIISAAWIPYICLNIKKYISFYEKKYLIYAAALMGLSIQGGYPEVWIMTLIVLFPYMMMCLYEKNVIRKVKKILVAYTKFGVMSLCASAIIVIPTIQLMPYMQRLNGNQSLPVYSYEWKYFLSACIPRWGYYLSEVSIDLSMFGAYMGILTVLLLPNILCNWKKRENKYLVIISIFVILMMLGNNTPLHPLFQKYFPMFSSLRFPSSYRCILAFLLLECTVYSWYNVFNNKFQINILKITTSIAILVLCSLKIWLTYLKDTDVLKEIEILNSYCIILAMILSAVFLVLFTFSQMKIKNTTAIKWICLLIFVEMFWVYKMESPITIGYVDINENIISNLEKVRQEYNWYYLRGKERTYGVDYSDAKRGNANKTGNCRDIILSNELSEVGYTQVKLDCIENYRNCANRYIVQGNPVFYYTSDVVTKNDAELEAWLNTWGVNSRQIYVEQIDTEFNVNLKEESNANWGKEILCENIKIDWNENIGKVESAFNDVSDSKHNAKWKIYVKDKSIIGETVDFTFYRENDEVSYNFLVNNIYEDAEGYHIFGSYPTYDVYEMIEFSFENASDIIQKFEYVESENEDVAEDICVMEFTPNKIILDTEEIKDGYLVTLQTNYPGWRVWVDSVEKEIVDVNGVFRGVYLSKGQHEICFRFIPLDFYIGLLVSSLFYLYILYYQLKEQMNSKRSNRREEEEKQ